MELRSKTDIKSTLIKIEASVKSRKRRLPIDKSDLTEVTEQEEHLAEISCVNDEQGPETNLITFECGTTQRGAVSIWHGGYKYIKRKGRYWRCANKKCPGTARADEKDGQYIGNLGECEHNHLPSIHKKICEEIRSKIKSGDSPSLAEIRANVSNEVFVSLGSDAALQKLIKRQKNKLIGNVNCANLDKIVIPESLIQKYGSSTLIYDSRKERGNKDVVLVFSHPRLLNILSQNKQWLLDGTIKLAPKPFVQCLCLGAFVQGHIIICVQALISNKRSFHYEEALKIIKRLISSNGPKKVISDFDKSEISSMQTIFPSAHLSGSLFHFGQSLSQKWKEFGLDRLFGLKTDEGECARTSFRRLLALALVPPQYVRRGFELIANSSTPSISSFIDFFASTYIGLNQMEGFQQGGVHVHLHPVQQSNINTNANFTGLYDNTFQPNVTTPVQFSIDSTHNQSFPEYPIAFWNVNEDVKAKTNNAFQSSHFYFANKSNQLPSMSDFLSAILNDVDEQVDLARSAANFSNKKKVKYIKEQQILNILNEADEYDDDYQLLNILTLIGLQLTGYIDKLSISNASENSPSKKKKRASKNGEDSETSLINVSDCPSSSSGLFFKNY